MKITIWSKLNSKSKEYEHNHIENEHVDGDYPLPLNKTFKEQRAWKSYQWKKEFGELKNNIVVI